MSSQFSFENLTHRSLAQRQSQVFATDFAPLDDPVESPAWPHVREAIAALTVVIQQARSARKPVILFLGAHPIKLGLSRYLIALIRAGQITHLALTGAALLHDWEILIHGATSESVQDGLQTGQFGCWQEAAALGWLLKCREPKHKGLGRYYQDLAQKALSHPEKLLVNWLHIGLETRSLLKLRICHPELSLLVASVERDIPLTIHSQLGADIWHLHRSFSPRDFGALSWFDFQQFARSVFQLDQGGVYINMGSAVAGPEIFLKALATGRNLTDGKTPRRFMTAVFDYPSLPQDWRKNGPQPGIEHQRWFKNVLVRPRYPDQPGLYIGGDFRQTIPFWYQQTLPFFPEETP